MIRFLDTADAELRAIDIHGIAVRFQGVLDEFLAVTETFVTAPVEYRAMLTKMTNVICERFGIQRQIVYVRASMYGTEVWGPLFWKFLHYASILITYMYDRKEINDMLDFPIIVYNINYILPCSVCAAHYNAIKRNDATKLALKEMSFGNLMSGLQMFHNLVTANIDSTPPRSNVAPRPMFTLLDFAKTYECIETAETETTKSLTYIRNRVDWQPDMHRSLSVLYALAQKINYRQASKILKATYGRVDRYEEAAAAMRRALTLNVDRDLLETNLPILESAVLALIAREPKCVRDIVDRLSGDEIVTVGNDGKTNKEVLLSLLREAANQS